jgi:hypothetical protein
MQDQLSVSASFDKVFVKATFGKVAANQQFSLQKGDCP